jgi:putative membrane protein
MKTKLETSMLALAVAGVLVLPATARTARAADDSGGTSVTDSARSFGESTKDAAKSAGAATKDAAKGAGSAAKSSAEGAAGYVSDTAKSATARLAGKDTAFVRKAAIGGLAEVKSAELAKSKASSDEVKSFAEQMIKDHGKAKEKGFTLPTELDNQHQSQVDQLSKLSGDAFDETYVKQQRKGHETMLRLLEDEAKNGKDADLRSFATKTKDVVSEHKDRVDKLGGTASSRTAR